ncbi:DGQHR domain-containing protein [Paludibaculum fermentans]|uniref:DGQHR domain-containing protein n=1 Tax=Paludibaculum fermentans TaxID=1473598 RepID=A0A7S7SLK3_PALFE|nr:DGQHR domain-containing protein [Paludibaculum fermentans]QOY88536.1 DGQHR domain-containing protein [Paludibaculum fermentans]
MTESSKVSESLSFSYSLVTQGKYNFYTLTVPSDVLARTCFVSTRDEDPKKGFQRVLDAKRAEEIAAYIDSGLGTIPSAIVLSAQPEAEMTIDRKKKTLGFKSHPRAFLVLDGQHRVYGFSKAKTALRVPVVVYNGLSRRDETRLFIDINTKQRPVSNELLLDIKNLAEYESDVEAVLRELFDQFMDDPGSPLLGLMSPANKAAGKLTRVTFNAALRPLMGNFGNANNAEIYSATAAYLTAFIDGLAALKAPESITSPVVFRAVLQLFPEVAQKVKDRKGAVYTPDNFAEVMGALFDRLKKASFSKPGLSYRALYETMSETLRKKFSL